MQAQSSTSTSGSRPDLNQKPTTLVTAVFVSILAGALLYMAYSLNQDIGPFAAGESAWLPYILLGAALLIALGFEFVNGFHDTANAVATVIYTNSMKAPAAVVWSGFWNFLGVLFSSGLVAFGIIALLPVELILQVGTASGFAMVFALLLAAIIWNLGTWFLGLPASSSHTLIGSIIGVGAGNALIHGRSATAGIDWAQVQKVGLSLLISPLIGFLFAALLLLLAKKLLAKRPELFQAPKDGQPPPPWVRSLLIFTCTGVSFAHGSNDGQKGMGLIMLILVGTLPTVYGLNHAVPSQDVARFAAQTQITSQALRQTVPNTPIPADSRLVLSDYVRSNKLNEQVVPALADTMNQIARQAQAEPDLQRWDDKMVGNIRNDMYLAAETAKRLDKQNPEFAPEPLKENLQGFRRDVDRATKFIPTWVKVMVAIALGLGTMVGWKRIVITVGEKIGKTELSYGQGATAELVAMSTIAAADGLGLPVSTTQVLSSGVAGTMVANKSGLQKSTVRSLALAWLLTLPASMLLSGLLFWLFNGLFA